jgi:hypothetical protein
MNLVIIDGYLGAGKTLAMTLLSLYFQGLSDCALYSNYGVKDSKEFTHFRDFLTIANESSSIVCLDEAHTDLDSRNFNTNSVKYFTHLIFYLRKLRCTLMLATPSIDNLDSRVRSISNLYIHVTKDKNFFFYQVYDMQGGRFLKEYRIKQKDAFFCSSLSYDTYNMVLPVEFPTDRNEYHTFVKELKQTSNDYYTMLDLPDAGERLTPLESELESVDYFQHHVEAVGVVTPDKLLFSGGLV